MAASLVHLVRSGRRRAAHPASPFTVALTDMPDGMPLPAVRAPDFPDTLDWLHTGGRRLTLGDFRGKLLLLDFWTYG